MAVEQLLFSFLGDSGGFEAAAGNVLGLLGKIQTASLITGTALSGFFTGIITFGVKAAAEFEQTSIAFETLIGNAEDAERLLSDLSKFSTLTGFSPAEVRNVTKQLIQFLGTGEELIDALYTIGNAATGTNSSLSQLAINLSQIAGQGRLTSTDFKQFASRGVLSLQDIAKHFDITTAKAQEMMSKGMISFEDTLAVLKGLSEEGGRFEGMIEKQGETFLGMLGSVKNGIAVLKRQIGEEFLPIAKQGVEILLEWVEAAKQLDPETKRTAAGFIGAGAAAGTFSLGLTGALFTVVGFIGNILSLSVVLLKLLNPMGLVNNLLKGLALNWFFNEKVLAGYGREASRAKRLTEELAEATKKAGIQMAEQEVGEKQKDTIGTGGPVADEDDVRRLVQRLKIRITAARDGARAAEELRQTYMGLNEESRKLSMGLFDEAVALEKSNKEKEKAKALHDELKDSVIRTTQGLMVQFAAARDGERAAQRLRFAYQGFKGPLLNAMMALWDMTKTMQKHHNQMEKGKELTKELADAETKHAMKVAELDELLKKGAIDQETYDKAVKKSKIELGLLDEAVSRFNEQFTGGHREFDITAQGIKAELRVERLEPKDQQAKQENNNKEQLQKLDSIAKDMSESVKIQKRFTPVQFNQIESLGIA